jgi:uncharacterized DUF497 family protein
LFFAWDDANRDHIAKHGVAPIEAEFVVENATQPFPQHIGDGKRRVWGATREGRMLQVIYVLKKQEDVQFESVAVLDWIQLESDPQTRIGRVIHAMELTTDMKRRLRKLRR